MRKEKVQQIDTRFWSVKEIKEFVTIVGGVNGDIIGFPLSNLVPQDSNPGEVKISPGGVGSNIAENLGVPT